MLMKLYRHILSGEFRGKRLAVPFRDRFGKVTVVKYKLIETVRTNYSILLLYIMRLDGRSIRYMREVEIMENRKEEAKRWRHSQE